MSSRVTRGSVAKEASVSGEAENENANVPQELSIPPTTTKAAKKKNIPIKKIIAPVKQPGTKEAPDVKATTSNTRKRKRVAAPKLEEDPDELPHNLGKAFVAKNEDLEGTKDEDYGESSKKQATETTAVIAENIKLLLEAAQMVTAIETQENQLVKGSRKRKTNAYGLTPGLSPFPDWPHPTPEECQQVVDLLSQVHGPQIAPETIPIPSLTVSGCGEVPSILDAMIRTLLSAATTGTNSSRAFQGLVDKFGIRKEGVGKGSVDWDAVRRAEQTDIFEAIKSGGLASSKSKSIKAILEKVYEENMARRDALLKARELEDRNLAPKGAENQPLGQQHADIMRADQHVLSLDHLHALPTHDAMEVMMKYPGIGVKTSSCVALFCMRRPSLAVDTHVFRLLKWLNWVPPNVKSEIAAFSHVEVRVPDELKYSLHQLFIKHGKACPRCRAATGETSEDWDQGCIIDHLVTRTGKRKGGVDSVLGKKATAGRGVSKRKTMKKKGQELDASESDVLNEVETETENEEMQEDAVKNSVGDEGTAAKKTNAKIAKARKAATNAKKEKNDKGKVNDSIATKKAMKGKNLVPKKILLKSKEGKTAQSELDEDLSDLSDLSDSEFETEEVAASKRTAKRKPAGTKKASPIKPKKESAKGKGKKAVETEPEEVGTGATDLADLDT
jgi:endonuclease III